MLWAPPQFSYKISIIISNTVKKSKFKNARTASQSSKTRGRTSFSCQSWKASQSPISVPLFPPQQHVRFSLFLHFFLIWFLILSHFYEKKSCCFSYSKEALEVNAKLLEINPEYYTAWNYRKLAVEHRLTRSESDPDSVNSILNEELKVVSLALSLILALFFALRTATNWNSLIYKYVHCWFFSFVSSLVIFSVTKQSLFQIDR